MRTPTFSTRFLITLVMVIGAFLGSALTELRDLHELRVGGPAAWAARGAELKARDRAFKSFSRGKKSYKERAYQEAEESFRDSLKYLKDHQTLYYLALSIAKQGRPCQDVVDAWRDYFKFCQENKSNCIKSWADKATRQLHQAEAKCGRRKVIPKTRMGNCPQGATLIGDECVISQVSCPAGSVLTAGRCVAQATCPEGMTLQGTKCVAQVECPVGTYRKGARCLMSAQCNDGLQFIEGQCQSPPIDEALSVSGATPLSVEERSGAYDPSFLEVVPWWGYSALGIGVVSHLINFLTESPTMLDLTFVSAIVGYTGAGLSLGVAIYKVSDDDPSVATLNEAHFERAATRSSLRSDLTQPPVMFFRWSGTF